MRNNPNRGVLFIYLFIFFDGLCFEEKKKNDCTLVRHVETSSRKGGPE